MQQHPNTLSSRKPKVLVTGAAGFIGFHLCRNLLEAGYPVVGLDNLNTYYDPKLKQDRLQELGITPAQSETAGQLQPSSRYPEFQFIRLALEDTAGMQTLFATVKPDRVCHLAAQAGVRYSLEQPEQYVQSNLVGFLNILEGCRHHGVKHLVYASSSSVYGTNAKVPFSTEDRTDHPISLYAATKKGNELMAHTYSHLYGFATTGLRFFTVYGPWGRPDMALFLFTDAILKGKPIQVFNYGKMERDFTYIDDIVEGVRRILEKDPAARLASGDLYKLYNIGNNNAVRLMDFIQAIEAATGREAIKEMMPIQPGDVEKTWADVSGLARDYGYAPNTPVTEGVNRFVQWYLDYYQINPSGL
ncbi:NAD-dependent epimerase [Robiginitalea sp. M366]|uniref:NAD-dependent epimerase n=1 Tax=Robiginitalea aestuariiviva TaxID=3036903 RepID=UPI00240E5D2B|nr:NAD-dependent epimerase [Robiginitalea aestuariiviva]MDG1572742.1 NAD-dependent epimerase [Robiginitalea aestuariiviva]